MKKFSSEYCKEYLESLFCVYLSIHLNDGEHISTTAQYKWCSEQFGAPILELASKENEKETYYIMPEHQWDYWYAHYNGGFNFFFRNENDAALFKLWFG